ncbi:MAG: hypothetical protein R2875_05350 [Desulfobacterales bacterium]
MTKYKISFKLPKELPPMFLDGMSHLMIRAYEYPGSLGRPEHGRNLGNRTAAARLTLREWDRKNRT